MHFHSVRNARIGLILDALRRNQGGQRSNGQQRCRDGRKDCRIERLRCIEHGLDEAHGGGTGGQAEHQPIERRTKAIAQHEAQDLAALRAKRHAETDLSGALRREVREDSVQSHRRQHQREHGEREDQGSAQAGVVVFTRRHITRSEM